MPTNIHDPVILKAKTNIKADNRERSEVDVWLLTLHLYLGRVLTGSTGRATNTPSSLQRWSWDPPAFEIWKEDESEHKALGWWKGYRQGDVERDRERGAWGDLWHHWGDGGEELVVVPKHHNPWHNSPNDEPYVSQQFQQSSSSSAHHWCPSRQRQRSQGLYAVFFIFLFSASGMKFFHDLTISWVAQGRGGRTALYIGSLF